MMIELVSPALRSLPKAGFALEGELGRRLAVVTTQWILPAPFANPAMLEMFRNRDRKPYQVQMSWAGEFAGKYLTHAVQVYRLTHDARLAEHLRWFVKELTALQAADGYLGPWPEPWRLKKGSPTDHEPWDAWGHYHTMIGLLLWHEQTGDRVALRCVRRMADLFCRRFMGGKPERLHDTGCQEMNQAPIHSLAWFHRLTGEPRYLEMARTIEREFELPPAGDYIRTALAGEEFFQTPKPRWESLHPIMGLAELYYATGEATYRQAFEHLWWSMLKGDRHNNGGFTSGEKATGNPYDNEAIETCCTVAWMAMSVEMLRLTGNPLAADELELSMFNSGFGMMSPSGRWVTYNTPMNGPRRASAHEIVFQAQPGSPELNCCSVNGPRALGLACEWALMQRADGLALNYYGLGRMEMALPSGNRVMLRQVTEYPLREQVLLTVHPKKTEEFTLALRIPAWSAKTKVAVNGKAVRGVEPGRYLELRRRWRTGDKIRLALDFRPHFWVESRNPAEGAVDLERRWKLFGPVPWLPTDGKAVRPPVYPSVPALEGLTMTPAELTVNGVAYRPFETVSTGGQIAGRELFPRVRGRPILFGFTEWQAALEQDVLLFFAGDWWTAWYLNGKKVFDNQDTGGNGKAGDLRTRNNRVKLHLRQGRNLLAFRLSGGSNRGCWLSAGRDRLQEELAQGADAGLVHLASIYRGPILLACDPRHQEKGESEGFVPCFDAKGLKLKPGKDKTWLKPWLLMEAKDERGRIVRLCDFGSAGAAGNSIRSWLHLRVPNQPTNEFSRSNPLRTFRV